MKELKIAEIGDIVTGKTPKTKIKDNFGDGFLFITPNDMINGFPIKETERYLSKKGLEEVKNNSIDGISIIVDCIGSDLGNVALTDKECVTNQQINSITNFKKGINPYYIYFWFNDKKKYLQRIAGGTSVPIINKTQFSNIKIKIPSEEIQNKISNNLLNFENKIEINNKLINYLEEYSQLLFQKWFVDFNFPDKEGNPYKDSGGKMSIINGKTIPVGWDYNPLREYVSISNGISYTSEDIKGLSTGIPMINLNSFDKSGGYKPDGIKLYSGNYKNDKIVKPYDICIACTDLTRNADVIGAPVIIPDIGYSEYLISCDVIQLIPKSERIGNLFLEKLFKQNSYRRYIKGFANGTNVLHLNKSGIMMYKSVIPDKDLSKKVEEVFQKIKEYEFVLISENKLLKETRDLLIKKLIK